MSGIKGCPEIPDCHIRLSGFLESIRYSSGKIPIKTEFARENRITGCDNPEFPDELKASLRPHTSCQHSKFILKFHFM